MNDLYSTTPSPGNFFTLPLRPAKRARSHYSSQDAENNPKRLRQTSIHDDNETSVPNNKNVSPVNPPPQEQEELTTHTHMINPTPPNPSQINISTLNFPPMLLRKEKRRGLPIHKQFIHPGFFARYLDQQHPDIEFAISDYEEAWYYAVSLASKSVDLSLLAFVSPNVVGRKVEEEVSAACALITKIRLKTREEYQASKRAASALWVGADAQRFQELLEGKREKRRRRRAERELGRNGVEMDGELDVDMDDVEMGVSRMRM